MLPVEDVLLSSSIGIVGCDGEPDWISGAISALQWRYEWSIASVSAGVTVSLPSTLAVNEAKLRIPKFTLASNNTYIVQLSANLALYEQQWSGIIRNQSTVSVDYICQHHSISMCVYILSLSGLF